MKPISPVVPGLPEVTYAKDQPEYLPLPAHRMEDGTVITRWRLSWMERLWLLVTGDLYLWVATFNQPLQPILLTTERPDVSK